MFTRYCLIMTVTLLFNSGAKAQLNQGNSIIQAGGGWTSVIIESTAETASGYLLNGAYEKWLVAPVGIGGSVHYLHVSDQSDTGSGTATSLPVYLNGRYYFGKDKLLVFVRLSAGLQFSWRDLEYIGGSTLEDRDWGFTAGGGAGMVYTVTPNILVSLDYSIYWLKNAYYSNGVANTVTFNIGYILGN